MDEVPEDPEEKPDETKNVGEVRKKVEEMNWKDGKKPEGVDEWEEIDRAEASGTEEDREPPSEESKDLKRKVLERSESSQVIDEHAKRQRDTPPVSSSRVSS